VSEQKLRELSAHLQTVVEEERRAIAREIHDEIGGALTALRFDLSWIERNGDARRWLSAPRRRSRPSALHNRPASIVRSLRPPVLDAGIVPALEWQLRSSESAPACVTRASAPTPTRSSSRRGRDDGLPHVAGGPDQRLKHAQANTVDCRPGGAANHACRSRSIDDGHGIGAAISKSRTRSACAAWPSGPAAVGGWLEVSLDARAAPHCC
jgi:signal transduction histidine kinase